MVTSRELALVYPSVASQAVSAKNAEAVLRGKKSSMASDTLAPAQATEKSPAPALRPPLPVPNKEGEPAYLKLLAAAFAQATTQLIKNEEQNTKDLVKLQDLDQTMSSIVLDKTNIAITKEKKELEAAQKIQWEMKEYQERSSIVNDILLGLGAVLIVVTVVSCLLDAGASLALVPEEVAGEAALEGSGDAAAEGVAEGAGEGVVDGVDESLSDIEGEANADSEEVSNSENVAKDTTKVDKTGEDSIFKNEKVKSFFRNWKALRGSVKVSAGSMRALKVATGAVFATPMIMNAVAEITVAGYKRDLADTQEEVGKQVAVSKLYGSYLQWYQQLVGRGSGIIQDLASQLGNTIETAGDTMSAYRQVTQGMSQGRRA